MFAEHGTVSSCIIMRDDEGKSKVRRHDAASLSMDQVAGVRP